MGDALTLVHLQMPASELNRTLGCAEIVTATGVPGPDGAGPSYRNIPRAGFVSTDVRPNWERPAR